MGELKLPTVTAQEVQEVEREKLQAFGTAIGFVGTVTALNYRFNAPGGSLLQKPLQIFFTGIKVEPTAAGRASVSFPKASIFAALLPTPVGYVPPEAYGLHPEFWKRSFTPLKPGQKPPLFSVSETRIKVFEARQAVDAIAARAAPGSVRDASGGAERFAIPPGSIPVSVEELAWLKSLPPGVSDSQAITSRLDARRDDLIGGEKQATAGALHVAFLDTVKTVKTVVATAANDVFAQPVAPGSRQLANFHPVTSVALAALAAAEGIRKELISERADP